MRTSLRIGAGALLLSLLASAAQAGPMEDNLEEKLKKEFVTAVPWVMDYDEALAQSKQSGKPIFAYFTRSYSP